MHNIIVQGEISNFKRHAASGHIYFSLKDESAAINCVMFRSAASKLRFMPKNGDAVLACGSVSVYSKTGVYQLYVDRMLPQGTGLLQLRYEELKDHLAREGVFKTDSTRRALPAFPDKIGIVTSPTGAVIRDMARVIGRRWPLAEILVCPANVQGKEGAKSISDALFTLYDRNDLDVIIVGRGGGSIEDLWNFNEEIVVRTIAASPVPIISAVGHETDYTLSDLACDWRAGTPSIAGEMVVPDAFEIHSQLLDRRHYLDTHMKQRLERERGRLDAYLAGGLLLEPSRLLSPYAQHLDGLTSSLLTSMERILSANKQSFAEKTAALEALSPLKVLSRGFACCEKEGHPLHSIQEVSKGDQLNIRLIDGSVTAVADEICKGDIYEQVREK